MKRTNLITMVVLIFSFFTSTIVFNGCGKKDDDVIKIGAVLPITGNSAEIGDYTLKGLQQAIDEKNEMGGLLSKKIELVVEDSKAEPKEGINAINKLLKFDDPIFVYSIISGVTMAIRPITEKNDKILIGAVGAVDFLDGCKLCIRNFVDPIYLGSKISLFLSDSLKAKRIGIFYANTEYGRTVGESVAASSIEKNIEIGFKEPYEDSFFDYKNIVLKYKNSNVDYIYVAGVGRSLGLMIKEIRAQNLNAKIIGDEMIPYPDVINSAGDAIKGVYYLDFVFDVDLKDDKVNDYTQKFFNKFNSKPNNLSVITYEMLMLYFSAVEKTLTFNSTKVIEELNKKQNIEGIFGNVSITNNNVEFEFTIKQMK